MNDPYTSLLYIDMSRDSLKTGGSSLAQILTYWVLMLLQLKTHTYFRDVFNTIQELISRGKILSGHDISAGGMLTTLLEMCFPNTDGGMSVEPDSC